MVAVVVAIIIGIIIGILFAFFYFRSKLESIERRLRDEVRNRELMATKLGNEIGQQVFEQRRTELEGVFEEKYKAFLEQWKVETEKAFREDALAKSRAVLKGALAEQLAPIFKVFGHAPSDARFIGDPVDYVIFENYTKVHEREEDVPISIVLADVKTGGADLTYEQRRIRQGIEQGLVRFEIIKM